MLSERSQNQKATYCMINLYYVGKRQNYGDGEDISGCPALRWWQGSPGKDQRKGFGGDGAVVPHPDACGCYLSLYICRNSWNCK